VNQIPLQYFLLGLKCQRLVPLGFWLDLATRAGVPHIPAIFSPPFPVDEIFGVLDGKDAPGLQAAFVWLKDALYSFVDEGRLPMVRWECCCDDDGKLRASKGEGWSAAWTETTPDSPRVVDCTVGETTRLCVRPWVHAIREAGYPVELRVFYGPEGYQGVSNYYPQRPLRKSPLILEAVRRARAAARLMAGHDAFPIGFSADFLVTGGGGEVIFLEGGPPYIAEPPGLPSAHPCCFVPGKVRGIALRFRSALRSKVWLRQYRQDREERQKGDSDSRSWDRPGRPRRYRGADR